MQRGDKSAATLLFVAGRSIMGVVPPFDRRDVETFEGSVAYISNLWIPAGPLYTFRVHPVHEFPLIDEKLGELVSDAFRNWITDFSSFFYSPTCVPVIAIISDRQ